MYIKNQNECRPAAKSPSTRDPAAAPHLEKRYSTKAPFSTAVCFLSRQNSKDYFDQSLDEIKLLRYINAADPDDEHGILRLYDYFYYRVRLDDRLWQ